MVKAYVRLFESGKIGSLSLKNRIVQSPLHTRTCEGFELRYSHWYTEFFRDRAKRGIGLIITGHVKAEKTIDRYPIKSTFPCMDSDLAIRDFCEVTEAVHHYGAKIAVQLSAGTGRLADEPMVSNWLGAPSRLPIFHPRNKNLFTWELSRGEIGRIVEAYGYAAGIAKRAGFDALYLYAHAYLIDQFLSSCWNQRTDDYGGNLKNRMRFLFEGSRKLDETIEIAKKLQQASVHALRLREGSYDALPRLIPNIYGGRHFSRQSRNCKKSS